MAHGIAQFVALPCVALTLRCPTFQHLGIELRKPDLPDTLHVRLIEHDAYASVGCYARGGCWNASGPDSESMEPNFCCAKCSAISIASRSLSHRRNVRPSSTRNATPSFR